VAPFCVSGARQQLLFTRLVRPSPASAANAAHLASTPPVQAPASPLRRFRHRNKVHHNIVDPPPLLVRRIQVAGIRHEPIDVADVLERCRHGESSQRLVAQDGEAGASVADEEGIAAGKIEADEIEAATVHPLYVVRRRPFAAVQPQRVAARMQVPAIGKERGVDEGLLGVRKRVHIVELVEGQRHGPAEAVAGEKLEPDICLNRLDTSWHAALRQRQRFDDPTAPAARALLMGRRAVPWIPLAPKTSNAPKYFCSARAQNTDTFQFRDRTTAEGTHASLQFQRQKFVP
jgi:hypothetical protein